MACNSALQTAHAPASQLLGEERIRQLGVSVLAKATVPPFPAVQVIQTNAAQLVCEGGEHYYSGWGSLCRQGWLQRAACVALFWILQGWEALCESWGARHARANVGGLSNAVLYIVAGW